MITEVRKVSPALTEVLLAQIGADRFDLWFGEHARLALSDSTLTVTADSEFRVNWLRSRFRRELVDAARAVSGTTPQLRFHVDPELRPVARPSRRQAPSVRSRPGASPELRESPSPASPRRAPQRSVPRRPLAKLDALVVGESNRLAVNAVQMVLSRLGAISPLFLHGPSGVGKTHMLESMVDALGGEPPSPGPRQMPTTSAKPVQMLSSEQFTSQFLEALHDKGVQAFRQRFAQARCVVLDDVQFFEGKRATIAELLTIVDQLLRSGAQLVIAADRPPSELQGLGKELVGRLSGGLVCRIEPIDQEVRRGLLERIGGRHDLELAPGLADSLAARLPGDARQITGAVNRLVVAQQIEGGLDERIAERTLSDILAAGQRVYRLPEIDKAVCEVFGLTPQSLQSASKIKRVSQPRAIAMWMARRQTRAALSEIGEYFGKRSHSTVCSAQKKVDRWLADGLTVAMHDRQASLQEAVRRVEAMLRASTA